MDVRKYMKELRLREAVEKSRGTHASAPQESAQHQTEFVSRRSSRQISARSSRPPSQFGDAESYAIRSPESPPEWYQHQEGNHTQKIKTTRKVLCSIKISGLWWMVVGGGWRDFSRTQLIYIGFQWYAAIVCRLPVLRSKFM